MPKIDFAKAKEDIAQIVDIVKTVPEALQQRCFEMLFEAAFSDKRAAAPESEEKPAGAGADAKDRQDKPSAQLKKLPANVLAFMHRHDVSQADLGKIFMLAHDPLLPVYKIPTGNMSKAQMFKVMMILLENGLLANSMAAPYTELRQSLKDDSLYDTNFNKMLRRNHDLFRGAVSADALDENGVVELTGSGMAKLAEIVKELGQ